MNCFATLFSSQCHFRFLFGIIRLVQIKVSIKLVYSGFLIQKYWPNFFILDFSVQFHNPMTNSSIIIISQINDEKSFFFLGSSEMWTHGRGMFRVECDTSRLFMRPRFSHIKRNLWIRMVFRRLRTRPWRTFISNGTWTFQSRRSKIAPAQLDGISAAQTQGRKMGIPCTVSETGIIT